MPSLESLKAYEEHCLNVLRAHGFRITMPRIQVIRALGEATTALSAYAIHEQIMGSGGRIDVVSVYRILSTLQQVGLIHYIGLVDGYFPCRSGTAANGRSMVLVDETTKSVVELTPTSVVTSEIEAAVARAGFKAETVKVEIFASKG
jgi:Fe2+ or Zn2+ uptake regulation protein